MCFQGFSVTTTIFLQNIFISSVRSPHLLALIPCPCWPQEATTNFYSDSEQFLILSLAYKQNYAICVVFFLLSSFFSSVKNYQGSSMCQNQDSVSLKGTIIFPFMDITHLLTHCSVGYMLGCFSSLSVMDNDAVILVNATFKGSRHHQTLSYSYLQTTYQTIFHWFYVSLTFSKLCTFFLSYVNLFL